MYIAVCTKKEHQPNPDYYPEAGRLEPESILVSVKYVYTFPNLDELGKFVCNRTPSYEEVQYFEANQVFPKVQVSL